MDLIKKISSETGLSEEEILNRIDEKRKQSDMISEEGAAYLIAKELGISLLRKQERLNIASIIPGMQNVDIIGRMTRIAKKDFETEKAKGRLANVFLSDETGTARLVLWNDEIEKLDDLSEGDVVHIRGFVKEGLLGPEIRIGRYGSIVKSDEQITAVTAGRRYERSSIADLNEGDANEVKACLVHVFESNPFYEVCPQCNGRVKEETNYKCDEHGNVEPAHALVVSGIIDDGTENMRFVSFGENAEKILGMKTGEARKAFMKKMDKKVIFENVQLGRELLFDGVVRRNKLYDRLEFILNNIKSVDVKKEIERLLVK